MALKKMDHIAPEESHGHGVLKDPAQRAAIPIGQVLIGHGKSRGTAR
jgi:hypothetical protein